MTTNDLLARCDYGSCTERAILLDKLRDEDRLEEELLLSQAGLPMHWDPKTSLVWTPLLKAEPVECVRCLYCGQLPCDAWPCEHIVATAVRERSRGLEFSSYTCGGDQNEGAIKRLVLWIFEHGASPVHPAHYAEKAGDVCADIRSQEGPDHDPHYALFSPCPEEFVRRLANLVQQRAAAGCPIRLEQTAAA